MNKIIKVSLGLFTILFFSACGSLKKNAEATALASTKTTSYRYSQSLDEIEKGINQQMMTMNMVAGGMGKAQDMEIKSPLERSINLKKIRYKGEMIELDRTKKTNKAYNLLVDRPKTMTFVGKRISSPSDETYGIYTIEDKGSYRTVKVETIDDLIITRQSKDSVNVSIMGVGINYKDFYDLDQSMKKAYIDEKEQYAVLRRVDSDAAEKLYTDARSLVDGKEFETRAN